MEAKIIMGNKIAVVTNDRDEFGDPHKTENIISYDAAIKLMMELGHCVDIVQEKAAVKADAVQCGGWDDCQLKFGPAGCLPDCAWRTRTA